MKKCHDSLFPYLNDNTFDDTSLKNFCKNNPVHFFFFNSYFSLVMMIHDRLVFLQFKRMKLKPCKIEGLT